MKRIQVGEIVIGTTGMERYGTRQVIGEYAGKFEDNAHLVKVTKKLLGTEWQYYERCRTVRRIKSKPYKKGGIEKCIKLKP